MKDLIKYALLAGIAVFGIGSYFVLNQADTEFVVVEKLPPSNPVAGPFRIVCRGNSSGDEYRFELPAEDFAIVQVNHRLRQSTVARWETLEGARPQREPYFLQRVFMR